MVLIKKPEYGKRINLIIIGAGVGGELISRHILDNLSLNYNILGFLDDDKKKIGLKINGLPVIGFIRDINLVIKEKSADEILIAMPSISGEVIKRIFEECKNTYTKILIMPGSFEDPLYFEQGKANFELVRELRIDDFFRRKPIISDFSRIKDFFSEKTILVTGAAGSIGSELCRQLLNVGCKIIALDNRETALHELGLDLREKHREKIITVLADIRDKPKIKKTCENYKPSIIFHAAAYKHVPMTETHPDEAVKTNIFGTQNLIEIADELNIESFILISTDKSANPICTLGLTKGVAEIITNAKSKRSNSKFLTVRFGNVLNSDGSIVPLFEKQIQKGGPITITHPETKRFFMTIPEAVQLVIQSVLIGKSGELFVLDMGEQYNILELAETMIRLKGLEPYIDIGIKFIGLRKGDKMEEVLLNSYEEKEATENSRIFMIKNNLAVEEEKIKKNIEDLKKITEELDSKRIIFKLREISNQENKEKFIPYNLPSIGKEEIDEVVDTLNSGWLTMGPKTIQFEKKISEYLGVKNVIAVNSCTAALHLSLLALNIGDGDEVIVPPYTFTSSANVIVHCGAKPIFVDVEKDTCNIDASKIERAITPNTKAVMVVHYAGHPTNMDEIKKIADRHNIKIIEDAAHAIGSEYNGRKIGSLGNLTCFSFYATKNLTTGEGGAISTNDDSLADKIRSLRLHGINKDAWKRYEKGASWFYTIEECGWKYNMTDLQASLGIHQLNKINDFTEKRRKLATIYSEELSKINGIMLPCEKNYAKHVYHLYPIFLDSYDRNKFIEEMYKKEIGTSVHFIPLHLQPFYQNKFGYKKGDFPVAESLYNREVSLPLYPKMSEEEVKRVVKSIKEILIAETSLNLRLAELDDCEYIYRWRNDSVARKASRNTQEIPYSEHVNWFNLVIADSRRRIYMALEKGKRVGQIRFDKQGAGESEVSITVDPEKYNQGYGSRIVRLGTRRYLEEEPDINIIRAEIRRENKSSLRIFEKEGYTFIGDKGEWQEFWFKRVK